MENRVVGRCEVQTSAETWNRLLAQTVSGGAAFWMVDFLIAVSPFGSAYLNAFFISSLQVALVEALVGGLVIAFYVSCFLHCRFDRIPGSKTITKVLFLCICALASIEILSAIANQSNAYIYLVLDTGMNMPRFIALGWMISYVFDQQTGKVQ